MTREFITTAVFEHQWKDTGLTDDDLFALEDELIANPQSGKVIQGTNGVRKMRFALPNRGKSGSVRVCYVDFVVQKQTYFLLAYAKNEKTDLTPNEKKAVAAVVAQIKSRLE